MGCSTIILWHIAGLRTDCRLWSTKPKKTNGGEDANQQIRTDSDEKKKPINVHRATYQQWLVTEWGQNRVETGVKDIQEGKQERGVRIWTENEVREEEWIPVESSCLAGPVW